MTSKKPVSAAATARVISRILREHGFKRAIIGSWIEGYYVHRVGYFLPSVHVDYFVPDTHRFHKDYETRDLKVAQMREVLFELGYVSSHPHAIYIECKHS